MDTAASSVNAMPEVGTGSIAQLIQLTTESLNVEDQQVAVDTIQGGLDPNYELTACEEPSVNVSNERDEDEMSQLACFWNFCSDTLFPGDAELILREEAVAALQDVIHKSSPEICVELYGSSFIGAALVTSDVNVFLSGDKKLKHDALLAQVHGCLSTHANYSNLEILFESKCVSLSVEDVDRRLKLHITEKKVSHVKSNKIVKWYLALDTRAMRLAKAVHAWAHLCEINHQQRGSLPTVAYYIMVIHFLQQQQLPVLPCLEEMFPDGNNANGLTSKEMEELLLLDWKSRNEDSVDTLLLGFFRFYLDLKQVKSNYTIGVRRKTQCTEVGKRKRGPYSFIEDPLSQDGNLATSMRNKRVMDYFESSLSYTYNCLRAENNKRELLYLCNLSAEEKKKFYKMSFTNRESAVYYCFNCNKNGHWLQTCPLTERIKYEYKRPSAEYLALLDNVLEKLVEDFGLSQSHIKERAKAVHKLEATIRHRFEGSSLSLFGSSVNGFGFVCSDLDVCMMSHGPEEPADLDKQHLVKELTKYLKKCCSYVNNIVAIASAKVPIVRFHLSQNNQEVDISLYNCLALRNSKLLHMYSSLDPRVRMLGFAVKLFAKMGNIGDASQGSLSSYAYILMVIHFLQQTSPPVLPVLQELFPPGHCMPELIVEECNTWFYDDMTGVKSAWSGADANSQPVSELWLQFLWFYTCTFNWKENVVCIRQKAPLTKLSKGWLSSTVAIEDPFNHHHNLGNGVKQNMYAYILSVLARALNHFAAEHQQQTFSSIEERQGYFFNPKKFCEDTQAPAKRCFQCNRLGHFASECNVRRTAEREKRKGKNTQRRESGSDMKKKGPVKKTDLEKNRATAAPQSTSLPQPVPPQQVPKESVKHKKQGSHALQFERQYQQRPPHVQHSPEMHTLGPISLMQHPQLNLHSPLHMMPTQFGVPSTFPPGTRLMQPPTGLQLPPSGSPVGTHRISPLDGAPQKAQAEGEQLLQQWMHQMPTNNGQ